MIHAGISCWGLLQEMPIIFSIFVFLPPLFHHDLETAQRIPVIFTPLWKVGFGPMRSWEAGGVLSPLSPCGRLELRGAQSMFHWSRDEGDFFRCFFCSEKCFFFNLMNQNKGCVGNPAQKKFENHLEQIWFMKISTHRFTSTIWSLLTSHHGCFWEDVDGGVIERRDGEPTGVLREKALELIEPLDKEEFFCRERSSLFPLPEKHHLLFLWRKCLNIDG